MVARTLPFKARDKPDEELPSITEEVHRQIEAEQRDIRKQLKHAQEQLECRASCRCCAVRAAGRPKRTPLALARLRPSPVRARISSRSNSARPPRTVSISLPCGVVVSAQASLR